MIHKRDRKRIAFYYCLCASFSYRRTISDDMTTKKIIGLAAGIVISLVFLAGSFYRTDLHQLALSFRNTSMTALLLYLFFFALGCLTRAFMWRLTSEGIARAGLSVLFGGVIVGYMVNCFLPFRAGELFRAHYLTAVSGAGRAQALSTIFIERILDVISLGLLLSVSLAFGIHGLSRNAALFILTAWLLVVLGAGLLFANYERLERNKKIFAFVPQRIRELAARFIVPLVRLRNWKRLLILLLLAFLVWTCNYLGTLALLRFSFPALPQEAALLLFLFLNIGMLIPAAPGSLGVVQLAFWTALAVYGVPREQALALSLAYLASIYVFNFVVGLPYFLKAHLRLGGFSEEA
jgi:glycosyltransferase 2 family protein